MRCPRLTVLQLLLLVTLCALVVGLPLALRSVERVTAVNHVEFSPDDKVLAVSYCSGWVQIWDVSRPQPRLITETQLGIGFSDPAVRFVEDRKIAYAQVFDPRQGAFSRLKIWDLDTGRHAQLAEVPGYVTAHCGFVAKAGNLVILPDFGVSVVEVFDLREPGDAKQVKVGAGLEPLLALSPDGNQLVGVRSGSGLELVDLATGKAVLLDRHGYGTAAFSADGRTLVLHASIDGANPAGEGEDVVRAYDSSSLALLWQLSPGHFGHRRGRVDPNLLRLTEDGKRVAVVLNDKVVLYDIATKQPVQSVELGWHLPDPRWQTTLRLPDRRLAIWGMADGLFRSTAFRTPVFEALSHDGLRYARGCEFHGLTLCDIETGTVSTVMMSTSRWIHALILACGFIAWGICWGIARRRAILHSRAPPTPVSGGIKFAWGLMILSGAYIIVRTMAIMFHAPGWSLWGVPQLVVGLYSLICGVSRAGRGMKRVAVGQLLCLLLGNVVAGVSAVVLLVIIMADRVERHVSQPGSKP
ncbi:MAG: WD40 repeat domain-containing protein [Planctomycetes bacterium]|nr:WD40 repeat domain-containing protein [Planctomycetota bacterium]MBL7041768.1 WD40 repeat domain-containing protein [Pirellulaceae bacterium]